MSGRKKTYNPLPTGTKVTVMRKRGEVIQGKTAGPPIEHLKQIGEFYLIVKSPEGAEPFWRGSGRKSKERLLWEAQRSEIGMYAREKLMNVGG